MEALGMEILEVTPVSAYIFCTIKSGLGHLLALIYAYP
jgi:hypothetical protein